MLVNRPEELLPSIIFSSFNITGHTINRQHRKLRSKTGMCHLHLNFKSIVVEIFQKEKICDPLMGL